MSFFFFWGGGGASWVLMFVVKFGDLGAEEARKKGG